MSLSSSAQSFAWSLRLSSRAKSPRITISEIGKVELVWPKRLSQKYAPLMMEQHQEWVERKLAGLSLYIQPVLPPEKIEFPVTAQSWHVQYIDRKTSRVTIKEDNGHLIISGDLDQGERVRKALRNWIKVKAKVYLAEMLEQTAANMGVAYKSLSIRLQKQRWGSCSQKLWSSAGPSTGWVVTHWRNRAA